MATPSLIITKKDGKRRARSPRKIRPWGPRDDTDEKLAVKCIDMLLELSSGIQLVATVVLKVERGPCDLLSRWKLSLGSKRVNFESKMSYSQTRLLTVS